MMDAIFRDFYAHHTNSDIKLTYITKADCFKSPLINVLAHLTNTPYNLIPNIQNMIK